MSQRTVHMHHSPHTASLSPNEFLVAQLWRPWWARLTCDESAWTVRLGLASHSFSLTHHGWLFPL